MNPPDPTPESIPTTAPAAGASSPASADLAFTQRTHFGALDWAKNQHVFALVDAQGRLLFSLQFDHTPEGWQKLRERVAAALPAQAPALAVSVETNQGLAVEQLVQAGYCVYPINPKQAERFRERKAPSGVKDDALDAWSMAEALRTDGKDWRALSPEDPLLAELRLLCRDEVMLIEQRTALVNALQAALAEYYLAATAAFDDFTKTYAWDFIAQFPTPAALQAAGRRKWEKFLHLHRLARPESYQKRLEIFAQPQSLKASTGVVAAKSRLALSLVGLLRTLEQHLASYREAIEKLFAKHPDHDLFGSLPGAGPKLAPRLLAEIGDQRERFLNAQSLQCYAGTAPARRSSGNSEQVKLRRFCNHALRQTVHHLADLSRKSCSWAAAYYRAHREKGHKHACALRCLGQRWLDILFAMWRQRRPYDEARHLRDQIEHGSWLVPYQAKHQTPSTNA